MASILQRIDAPALPKPIRVFIPCSRCGGLEVPGLTYLTTWGLLCTLCHDGYENAHGAEYDPMDEIERQEHRDERRLAALDEDESLRAADYYGER